MAYEPPRYEPSRASDPQQASTDERDRTLVETEDRVRAGPFDGPLFDGSLFEGRLHPLTLLLGVLHSFRRLILPLIPLVLFNRGLTTAVILILLFGASLARALVRYFTFIYRIERGELITREGLLERTERHIPLERIQEIRIEQGVLHRLFGVVDASIETAGGKRPEATLSVLSIAEAERLRRAVFEKERAAGLAAHGRAIAESAIGESAVGESAVGDREILLRLKIRDLILAGLTSNHILSALVLISALMAFVDDVLPESVYERVADALSTQAGRLAERGVVAAAVAALLGLVALFVAGLMLSIVGSIALFYGFTLARRGEDLHRSYGLLTRRESSLPRRRIQLLEIKEGALRRLFHLAQLRADTAGSNFSEREERSRGQDVLLPIVQRAEVGRLLGTIFAELSAEPREWLRVSRLAVARGTIRGIALLGAVALALSSIARSPVGLWVLALIPVIYITSLMRYRALGYSLGERYFYLRSGWPGRSTLILPLRNVQAVAIRRTPLDRVLGLATLVIDSAGQARLGGPNVASLPIDEALRLGRAVAHRAAATRYRW